MDQAVNAVANNTQLFELFKTVTPQVAGCFMNLLYAKGIPGAGTYPSPGVNGAVPTSATAGALPFTNPTGGNTSYLSHLDVGSSQAGTLLVYDRLWHNSGLSTTSTSPQGITPTSLTRSTSGVGVEAWLDVYGTAMGAGATAPTIAYTNQSPASATGQVGTAQGFVASAAINRCFPFSLASGSTGVAAITSYNNVASHTSGAFGLVLRRRLASISVPQTFNAATLDFFALGGPVIPDDACLEFIWVAANTGVIMSPYSIGITQG